MTYLLCCRTAVVSQCDVIWSLMRNFSSGQDPVASLPPKVQRMLMFSLLFCDVGERKQQFVTEVHNYVNIMFNQLFPVERHILIH